MSTVVYGVDIATYEVGAKGQAIGRKGFAWARIVLAPETNVVDPSGFRACDISGCDLLRLALGAKACSALCPTLALLPQ